MENETKEFPTLESGVAAVQQDLSVWRDQHRDERALVLVAGPTASGKMTFVSRFVGDQKYTFLNLDRYYLGAEEQLRRYGKVNFSPPSALDTERINHDVEKILAAKPGETVSVPVYSMKESRRTGEEDIEIQDVIILKGLYTIDQVKHDTPFKIYIDAPEDTLLARKLKRDVEERGMTADVVRSRFEQNVRPAIRDYVSPQKNTAHYLIQNAES